MKEKELSSQPGGFLYIEIFLEQIKLVGWNSFFGEKALFFFLDTSFFPVFLNVKVGHN